MSALTLPLADQLAVRDLDRLIDRAGRVEDGAVRIQATGLVAAVTVPVLAPAGLLDRTPTVLGLRAVRLTEPVEVDRVVPRAALATLLGEAVAANAATVTIPADTVSVAWTGITPPRDGWEDLGVLPAQAVESVALAGVEEVRTAIPGDAGAAVLQKVRAEVWGRPASTLLEAPAGAAFACFGLGFLAKPVTQVRVFRAGPWLRLGTEWGQVLCRVRPSD